MDGAATGPDWRDDIWLFHLLADSRRERKLVELEDSVRSALEDVASSLVRDARAGHGLDAATVNATAINLVVQQALNLQREHAAGSQAWMVSSLLRGDPALAHIADALRTEGRIAERTVLVPHFRAWLRRCERRAARRGAGIALVVAALALAAFV